MKSELKVWETPVEMAQGAAKLVIKVAEMAIRNKGRFSWCLSGGNTPKMLYTILGSPAHLDQIDWLHTDIFWGDERCVPFDHPDSDYRLAYDALLCKIPTTQTPRIYRMIGEIEPKSASESYEALLKGYFGLLPETSFDLLLLGLGEDGHTASLFPGTFAIHEQHWVIANFVPKLSAWRLTLTPQILNKSDQVVFLVTGANKKDTLKAVREGPYQPDVLPSQVIQPITQKLIWMLDRAAAGN